MSVGTHSLTATFGSTTSAAVNEVINKAPTTTVLTVSPTTANPGQIVTLTATVAPASATGTVTFSDGTATLGTTALTNGTATLAVATLATGGHSVTATYSGDGNFAASTSAAVGVTVGQGSTAITLAASPNPATAGQAVTLTATVTPASTTGTITFRDGTTSIGTSTLTNGSATLTTSTLTVGTHSLTATVGSTTSSAVTLTINAASGLQITTAANLPAATVGTPYAHTFTATGGAGTLTWTLTSGAVPGLSFSVGGNLTGTPTTPGSYQLSVRVTDAGGQTANGNFTVTVNSVTAAVSVKVAPPMSITDQPVPQVSLSPAYPSDLNATFKLSFTPNAAGLPANYTNPGVQFLSGGTTTGSITIPANSTAPVNLPAVQLGTVAGTITITVASLTVAGSGAGVPIPSPAPSATITVPKSAPVITAGSVKLQNLTSTGFQVFLDAMSTPRDLGSASVTFTAASGTQLTGTQTFTVSLTGAAGTWFDPGNAAGVSNGGAFSLTIPFTYSGDTTALGSVSVTLTNSVGTSAAASGGR